jgi:transcriptional regulator with XRE-family HTH domain
VIRNERQLAMAKKKLSRVEEAAASAAESERRIWLSLVTDLVCEIREFEALTRGAVTVFEIGCMDEISAALIKARIAQKITQAELAERLGVSEQMVQKDEAGGYEHARATRLADVCDALGYELTGLLQPAGRPRVIVNRVSASVPQVPDSAELRLKPTVAVSVVDSFHRGISRVGSAQKSPMILNAER